METPNSVLLAVRKNDFLASIDLKDAYFQITVHPSSRKLLRFISNDTVYQFKALCFGLATAPQVFTRVFAAVSAWAHSRGVHLLLYLDDWLILSSSEAKTRRHVNQLLTLPLPGHSDKRGEIRPLPVQVGRIPRHDHRHSVYPSVPHRDTNTEIPLLGKEVSIPTKPHSPTVAGIIGTHVIVGETGTPREAPDALPPVASQIQLVHQERPPKSSGTPVPAGGQGHPLVDDEETPPRGDALRGGGAPPPNSAYTRTSLGRGGEPTSSINQRRDYGQTKRPHSTSIFWR